MEKVKLPREVAEALEKAKEWAGLRDRESKLVEWGINEVAKAELVAWLIPFKAVGERRGEYWQVLNKFGNEPGGFFKLIDALRYGYEIEPEPITVTITPEMQDELRKVYNDCPFNEKVGFRSALTVLDLKIPGVNA